MQGVGSGSGGSAEQEQESDARSERFFATAMERRALYQRSVREDHQRHEALVAQGLDVNSLRNEHQALLNELQQQAEDASTAVAEDDAATTPAP